MCVLFIELIISYLLLIGYTHYLGNIHWSKELIMGLQHSPHDSSTHSIIMDLEFLKTSLKSNIF